jgi:hypothetical protein
MRLGILYLTLAAAAVGCATTPQTADFCPLFGRTVMPVSVPEATAMFKSNGIVLQKIQHLEASHDSSGSLVWEDDRCSVEIIPVRLPSDAEETVSFAKFRCQFDQEKAATMEITNWLTCLRSIDQHVASCSDTPIDTRAYDRDLRVKALCFELDASWYGEVIVSDPSVAYVN